MRAWSPEGCAVPDTDESVHRTARRESAIYPGAHTWILALHSELKTVAKGLYGKPPVLYSAQSSAAAIRK